MKKTFGLIRFKLTVTVVAFTFCLLTLFTVMIFSIFNAEQQKSVLQSTEYNLQLVSGMIDRSIDKLQTLSLWSVGNTSVTNFLRAKNSSGIDALNIYDRLNEEWQSSPANEYVRRFILTDGADKLLQVGNSTTVETPLVLYEMRKCLADMSKTASVEALLATDVLSRAQPQVLLFLRPIILNSTERGLSYMAVSPQILTDSLRDYALDARDSFYITINGTTYQIVDKTLRAIQESDADIIALPHETLSEGTLLNEVRGTPTGRHTTVSYPLSSMDGWYITHSISAQSFSLESSQFYGAIVLVALLVMLMGIVLAVYLHRLITMPLSRLHHRIDLIAKGDFEWDDSIEWPNELGDVGRGINTLSKDVSELMDSRLADEKAKLDLEYKMLQNQVNPHFIYNTLNSIKWMATIQNATGIAEMTTAFSHLLKSVAKGNEALITLREEFALLNDYCTIQQYRYGGSIGLEIAEISDEALCECLIPRFTLQPLAENAIFHGIEPKGGVGSVWLRISEPTPGEVRIEMEDNGVGMSEQVISRIFTQDESEDKAKFKQIGVLNVHRRIQYTFGDEYGISIESQEGEYTRMIVNIPCRYKQGEEDTL